MANEKKGRGVRLDEALARRDRQVSDAVDPALISRLEAWFGPLGVPADESADAGAGLPPGWLIPEETPEQEWRRARALEAVADGSLLTVLEERAAGHSDLVEPLEPLEVSLDPGISRFDLARWGVNTSVDYLDRERPEELSEALREKVPQAILRDLHRPVPKVGPIELEQRYLGSRSGTDELANIRQLLRQRYRTDVGELNTPGHIDDDIRDLRQRLDREPWAEARPEEPSPWPSSIPEEDLMRWFMTSDED